MKRYLYRPIDSVFLTGVRFQKCFTYFKLLLHFQQYTTIHQQFIIMLFSFVLEFRDKKEGILLYTKMMSEWILRTLLGQPQKKF